MPIDFNRIPYYDDFNEDRMFYRLLFSPGRAVQARELTQIQSLLQNQIKRLGSHIFKDGSLVYEGKISYDKTAIKWLGLKAVNDTTSRRADLSLIMPGMKIRKPSQHRSDYVGTVEGKIIGVAPAINSDPDTLYFRWFPNEPEDPTGEGFSSNELLDICEEVSGRVIENVKTLDADIDGKPLHYGTSAQISVEPGIYFWKGHFVKSVGGSIVLSKYTSDATYIVGYTVKERIVTNDPSTYDPASQSTNYTAPGADRYEITLQLVKVGDGVSLDPNFELTNFIEVARIENGNLLNPPDGIGRNIYSVLGDELAKRTYEESGNYVATPYRVSLTDKTTTDNPKMVAKFTEGTSYVRGYRYSLDHQNSVEVDKGRDEVVELQNIRNFYGDNFVKVYDEANTTHTTHPDNANGLFVVGSGAGEYGTTDDYGQRGAAVSLHCVPKKTVNGFSLTDEYTWNSTLVGTARPLQMVYNTKSTEKTNEAGRKGNVYDLWLGDFKSSPISNTISVTNIIREVNATTNSSHNVYKFPIDVNHGITTDDRISVRGAEAFGFNVDNEQVGFANSTTIVVGENGTGLANPASSPVSDSSLQILRVAGSGTTFYNSLRTVVLNDGASAAWNGSYVGATIQVEGENGAFSPPVKIIDYIGTDTNAKTLYSNRNSFSKSGMVILEDDLSIVPEQGRAYKITMSMKQARSVVYNQNISATGADQYPAVLNQAWNIDPVTGVVGSLEKIDDEVYASRVDGDTGYNVYQGDDALLFDTGRKAAKTLLTHGNLDAGKTPKNTIYYTEYCLKEKTASSSATLDFGPASASNYQNFMSRPKPYPYTDTTITDPLDIKENFMLVNRTTGQMLSDKITQVQISSTYNITVTLNTNFIQNQEYALVFPVKAENVTPAHKKLIKANTTGTGISSGSDYTDFGNGHVYFAEGSYSAGNSGVRYSLLKPDGHKLRKVIAPLDVSSVSKVNECISNTDLDITSRFDFDTGQRDMFYDNASIVLKAGQNSPNGNMLVIFDYFQRMDKPKSESSRAEDQNSPSFFCVDSYQYTTDLILDHATDASLFSTGMKVVSNGVSGASGYVLEYSNATASTPAKVRLESVTAPVGKSGNFVVGEYIKGYNKDTQISVQSKIVDIVESDLKYSEIPTYKSREKQTYPLRNFLDFRPYVVSNNRVSDTVSNAMMMPIPTGAGIGTARLSDYANRPKQDKMSTTANVGYFAGRIDKLIVTKDGNYTTIKGTPSSNPVPPVDEPDKNALTLYTLKIPEYTFSPKNVVIKENTVKRHTMKDIGRLAKRVENLEYYVSLNSLERKATEDDLTFETEINPRFSSGIIVDNFLSTERQVVIDPRKSKAAIGSGVLRPMQITPYDPANKKTATAHFAYDYDTDTNVKLHHAGQYVEFDGEQNFAIGRSVTTLDYTSTSSVITQPSKCIDISVNPFDRHNFTGSLDLTPNKDTWIDVSKVPEYTYLIHDVLATTGDAIAGSSVEDVVDALHSIDDFWDIIAGTNTFGDDLVGTVEYNRDESLQTEEIARNITLGSVQDYVFNTSAIDAAIASIGMTDGVTKNIQILPYVRPRDIILHARGLKPEHSAGVVFDGTSVERYFGRANKVYLKYSSRNTLFQPEVTGQYEKIKLSATGSRTANAILVGVTELDVASWHKYSDEKYMVGYIVPEFDPETGKVDYDNYTDGYYSTSVWPSAGDIKKYGFNGTDSSTRTITGMVTGATAELWSDGARFNGHYTGQAAYPNGTTPNTTHIVLSEDANRYIPGNFRTDTSTSTGGYPTSATIRIVSGTGAGQECLANNLFVDGTNQVLELVQTPNGGSGLTTGLDATSVYSIGMKTVAPSDVSERYPTSAGQDVITQIGDSVSKSNHYGEKVGILHLPTDDRTKFKAGNKLVEVLDRYSKEEWLVTSYASAYYSSEGMERDEVASNPLLLERLKEVRSAASAFRVENHAEDLGYVPATNNVDGTEGKLAVVTGVEIANGTWTSSIDFVRGGGVYGTVDPAEQDLLRSVISRTFNIISYDPTINPDVVDGDWSGATGHHNYLNRIFQQHYSSSLIDNPSEGVGWYSEEMLEELKQKDALPND